MLDKDRPYWNMEIETKLDTPEMKEFQLSRLKAVLRRLYDNAPFYKCQFDELGIVVGALRQQPQHVFCTDDGQQIGFRIAVDGREKDMSPGAD